MSSQLEVLELELLRFEIELPCPQKLALSRYCEEVTHWNERINLTGLHGEDLARRLVVEPVWIGLRLKMSGVLADIGSGNGSPAIPLCIVSPFSTVHLIEARTRRAAFLRHLAVALQLPEVRVHRARFEEVAPTLGPVSWITLQGVALTSELLEAIRKTTSQTTNVVWITARGTTPPMEPTTRLHVPVTGTEVLLFCLDHSGCAQRS